MRKRRGLLDNLIGKKPEAETAEAGEPTPSTQPAPTGQAPLEGVEGVEMVGRMAHNAWFGWQQKAEPGMAATPGQADQAAPAPELAPPPEPNEAFVPRAPAGRRTLGRKLIRAMIASAYASPLHDGTMEPALKRRLTRLIRAQELDLEDYGFVAQELGRHLSPAELAFEAASREEAIEIYTAALLANPPTTAEAAHFLAELARQLDLAADLVAHLHAEMHRGPAAPAPAPEGEEPEPRGPGF